jgi:hypothetical protein
MKKKNSTQLSTGDNTTLSISIQSPTIIIKDKHGMILASGLTEKQLGAFISQHHKFRKNKRRNPFLDCPF